MGAPPFSYEYDGLQTQWIGIPSLADYITVMTPILNQRLSNSKHLLGHRFSSTINIGSYDVSTSPGCVIEIANCSISSVEEKKLAVSDLDKGLQIVAPRGALIQMLMGFSAWRELRRSIPDLVVHPAVVPVFEILFPKIFGEGDMYVL